MGPHTTTKQKIQLGQQRQKLSGVMKAFQTASRKFLPADILNSQLPIIPEADLPGVQWDDSGEVIDDPASLRSDKSSGVTSDRTPDTSKPEHQPMPLPSTLGFDYLKSKSLTHLAAAEMELWIGQMNDALQAIRTAIGYKSLLYRTKVRKATSYRTKLRSYDEVLVADDNVRKHVRIYLHARRAVTALYDVDNPEQRKVVMDLLARYRTIRREDLRANTTVLEAFTPGLRQVHASWIWNFEDNALGRDNGWMNNCTCFVCQKDGRNKSDGDN